MQDATERTKSSGYREDKEMKVGLALRGKGQDPATGALFAQTMMELLKTVDVAQTAPTQGNGTRENPYQGLDLQKWRWCAAQPVGEEPIFYRIGGRQLVRWGSKMTKLKDYISDMTSHQNVLDEVLGTVDKESVGKVLTAFSDPQTEHLAPYHKKALRLDQMTDIQAASRCRALLVDSNHDCSDCPELASTCCSLFIAEAHRAPKTFLISLMLLDLVEAEASYGIADNKQYTWISMLAHSKDTQGTLNKVDIPGRRQGKEVPLAKHPMAGLNTVKMGKDLNSWALDNASRDASFPLMSIWIGRYLKAANAAEDYYLLRTTEKPGIKEQVKDLPKKIDKSLTVTLRQQAAGALLQRAGTAGKLLNAGANLPYMDLGLQLLQTLQTS